MGLTALQLAKRVGLWVSRSNHRGHLRITSTERIVIGPDVSDDEIATVAVRHQLEKQLGKRPTEAAVRARLLASGFRYAGGIKPLRGAMPRHSNAHKRSA